MEITVVRATSPQQEVDAVVNAANNADARWRRRRRRDPPGRRAGRARGLRTRASRDGLATGDAGWTTAGDMPARWVIHVVGPNYTAGQTDRSLLTSCYARALEVADELGARTVAFPLVSAGIYGWPRDDAIDAAAGDAPGRPDRGRGGPDGGVRRVGVRRRSGLRGCRPRSRCRR